MILSTGLSYMKFRLGFVFFVYIFTLEPTIYSI
jgi:hypothetical protein